jgi:yersiniabactin nonribosomal peptide synthetase
MIDFDTRTPTPRKREPLTTLQGAYLLGRRRQCDLGGVACHVYLETDGKDIDVRTLAEAWQQLCAHHFMTGIRIQSDGTWEIGEQNRAGRLLNLDFSALPPTEAKAKAQALRQSLSHRMLRPDGGALVGLALCRLPNTRSRLIFDLDLLLCDVRSFQVILGDLAKLYCGRRLADGGDLASYLHYLNLRRQWCREHFAEDEDYWQNRAGQLPLHPVLPLAVDPQGLWAQRYCEVDAAVSAEQWALLAEAMAFHDVDQYAFMLASFCLALREFAEEPDFLLNLPLFARPFLETDSLMHMVGDFTQLQLFAARTSGRNDAWTLARDFAQDLAQDREHAAFDGLRLQRMLSMNPGRERGVAPIVFSYTTDVELITTEFAQCFGNLRYMVSQTPHVWLDAQVFHLDGGLLLALVYPETLFAPSFPQQLLLCWLRLLTGLAQEEGRKRVMRDD